MGTRLLNNSQPAKASSSSEHTYVEDAVQSAPPPIPTYPLLRSAKSVNSRGHEEKGGFRNSLEDFSKDRNPMYLYISLFQLIDMLFSLPIF